MNIRKSIYIILIIGLCLYFYSLFGKFLWDDEEQIVNNSYIHSISNIPEFFLGSTFNTGGAGSLTGIYYKPLLITLFSVIYSIFGNNSFFFHLFQLSLHIINSVCIFIIFNYFFNKIIIKEIKYLKRFGIWISFFGAILFLVHPINVESVVYISASQEVLFFTFGIMSFMFLILNKENIKVFNVEFNSYLLSGIFVLFAFLSKETGILFFIINIMYIFVFQKDRFKKFIYYFVSTLSIYIILRFFIARIGLRGKGITPIMQLSFFERLINIPKVIFFYFKTFFYPRYLLISQNWIVEKINMKDFYIPFIIIITIFSILIYMIFYFYRNKLFNKCFIKLYTFFLIWFIVGIGLHIQIIPLDMTVADRWFYFPIVGLIFILILITSFLIYKFRNVIKNIEIISFIIITFLLTIFSCRTLLRTFDWSSGLTLYQNDIKYNKNAYDLENNYGVELIRKNKVEDAKFHFEKSTKLKSDWWVNWNNLGVCYEREDDYEKALEYYKKSMQNADYYLAYENYTGLLINLKRNEEAKKFLEEEALVKFPYNNNLSNMYLFLDKNDTN